MYNTKIENLTIKQGNNTLRVAQCNPEVTVREYLQQREPSVNEQGHQVDIIWLDEEVCEDMNDPHFEMLINEFVNQQDFFSINPNGKIERIVIINEFNKFCYINKYSCSLKRDEIIEMVKDEYWKRHETKLNKQDFFESLKPQKFKYKW